MSVTLFVSVAWQSYIPIVSILVRFSLKIRQTLRSEAILLILERSQGFIRLVIIYRNHYFSRELYTSDVSSG